MFPLAVAEQWGWISKLACGPGSAFRTAEGGVCVLMRGHSRFREAHQRVPEIVVCILCLAARQRSQCAGLRLWGRFAPARLFRDAVRGKNSALREAVVVMLCTSIVVCPRVCSALWHESASNTGLNWQRSAKLGISTVYTAYSTAQKASYTMFPRARHTSESSR